MLTASLVPTKMITSGFLAMTSATAAAASPDITGPKLGEALKRMVPPGKSIEVGQKNITAAFAELSRAGAHIDFDGASGPLDFNVNTGEAESDILVWCVGQVGGKSALTNSGLYYSALTKRLEGIFNCP
ncbi:MAG: hypothetical protein NVS3B20_20160 [Polyangiales bacterium]